MGFRFGLLALTLAAIVAGWWWLGQPIAMPPSPLGPDGKLDCISYAPFRDGQTPTDLTMRVDPAQIEDDLTRLAPLTRCIRTYSVHLGMDQIVPIARRRGLKVLLGIWIGRDREFNRKQIATGVEVANRYPDAIRAVVVGNEVLLRGEQSPEALADIIRAVKAQISAPVTYADVWEFWLRSPKLADAVDFVTIHILPYWEDIPISADKAADHVASLHKRVSQAFPGRTILLGEVGWPSAGRMREGARPSPANQARVLAEVIARAHAENFPINVIESFDQPWKRFFEGTVGGHWGFMDAVSRAPKFAWGSPVSNHPQWKLWAALGAAFACLVLGAALFMERQMGAAASSAGRWGGVAIVATTAGLLAGLAGEAAQVESFALGGVLRSLALCTLVLIAPLVAAGTLMRFHSVPSFARILARMAERPNDPLDRLAGCTLVAATVIAVQAALGFVFDPRYRDFPNAPMTVVVVSFGVLWIFGKPRRGVRPLAETGAAILLALSAIFIAINETFANWQALWFCAAAVGLAAILTAVRDAPG